MSQGYYPRHEASAGSVLAAAREDLNLSVADVARHLKLSPAQVEALEQGAYDRLPGRVFVRGFLRNYAKLLGVDAQPLLRSIESQMPQAALAEERPVSQQVVMPRERPSRWPLYAALTAIVVVGALAIYEFGFNEAPSSPATGADTPAPAADAAPTIASESQPAAAPQRAPAGTSSALTAPPAPVSAVNPVRAAEQAAVGEQPGKQARTGEREVYFRFDQESWVEVRDRNGKVIFSKLNRAGSEERISGTPPLKLVVGNARGVRINYDDEPVDLTPHTGVTVARLTLQ